MCRVEHPQWKIIIAEKLRVELTRMFPRSCHKNYKLITLTLDRVKYFKRKPTKNISIWFQRKLHQTNVSLLYFRTLVLSASFSQRCRRTHKINHWIITLHHFFYQWNIRGFPIILDKYILFLFVIIWLIKYPRQWHRKSQTHQKFWINILELYNVNHFTLPWLLLVVGLHRKTTFNK